MPSLRAKGKMLTTNLRKKHKGLVIGTKVVSWRGPGLLVISPTGSCSLFTHSWLTTIWRLQLRGLREQNLWSQKGNNFLSPAFFFVVVALIHKVGPSTLWENGRLGEKVLFLSLSQLGRQSWCVRAQPLWVFCFLAACPHHMSILSLLHHKLSRATLPFGGRPG